MADTGSKRYSIQEALNRILRVLRGNPAPYDDPETLAGEVLATNEALSSLAELLEGNDPDNSFTLPNASVNQFTVEDLTANDSISARTIEGTSLEAGTGTFYAGYGRVSVGGYSDPDLYGNGNRVLGFAPASVLPSGTLAILGGVLFAQGGALKWLGSSGTITTLAGS